MSDMVDEIVNVITADGRTIIGLLRGFDQHLNIVLDQCHERIFSTTEGVKQEKLGLYIIRGENVAIVGMVDQEKELAMKYSTIKAAPLKPVIHTEL
jgi:U6 snRNA-associated Sm-like protein LSm8